MRLKSILCVVVLSCLLPAAGSAQDGDDYTREGWYLGAGGTWAPHWWEAPDDELGVRVKTKNSFGLNVRGGYRFKRWLAAELEYEWLDGFVNEAYGSATIFKLSTHVVTANVKFLCPALSRFQPYVLFGAGAAIFDIDDQFGPAAGLEDSSAGFAARATAGLDVYITRHWLLNVEAGAAIPTNEVKNALGDDLEELFYVPIQLGIQYRF